MSNIHMQISHNRHGSVVFWSAPGLTAAAAAAAAATNAAIAEAMKVKKIKLEVMSSYHNSTQHGDHENGDLSSSVGKSHTITQLLKLKFN